MATDKVTNVPLSEVLAHIAEELNEANKAAQARGYAPMIFSECEIDFAVELGKEGKAGLKLYILQLGGKIKRSESNTIKIKFTANPKEGFTAPALTPGGAKPVARKSEEENR